MWNRFMFIKHESENFELCFSVGSNDERQHECLLETGPWMSAIYDNCVVCLVVALYVCYL